MLVEKDYIMRMVRQFSEALQRILHLQSQEQWEEARQETGELLNRLFGPEADLLDSVDAATAARILGSWERIVIYARICMQQGEISWHGDSPDHAVASFHRGLLIGLEGAKQKRGLKGDRAVEVEAAIHALPRDDAFAQSQKLAEALGLSQKEMDAWLW